MPSLNKRINLTVPDALYKRLQAFKEGNGIVSDATACLQLITQHLNAYEQNQTVTRLMREVPPEQVLEIVAKGIKQ